MKFRGACAPSELAALLPLVARACGTTEKYLSRRGANGITELDQSEIDVGILGPGVLQAE
jgi:hypothetical protein